MARLVTLLLGAAAISLAAAQTPLPQTHLPCNFPVFTPNFPAFNFSECSAPVDIVLTMFRQWYMDAADTTVFNDASIVQHIIVLFRNAWFDVSTVFDDTAVGVYSRFPNRLPQSERTVENLNKAILYASRPVARFLFPNRHTDIDFSYFGLNGLDPVVPEPLDLTTVEGIATAAGNAVVEARRYDGMNVVGDFDGQRSSNFRPYADTTGYIPRNTAFTLKRADKWQPDVRRKGLGGVYTVQQFVTPQLGVTQPYSYANPNDLPNAEKPAKKKRGKNSKYRKQADAVLEASAALTEQQKLYAEFYDDKGPAVGGAILVSHIKNGASFLKYIQGEFLANMAVFDGAIWTWNQKRLFDYVRPFSAIRYLYGDDEVEAYGGVGRGTENITTSEWVGYLSAADHPEFPSATTCLCASAAQALRLHLGSDILGIKRPYPPGSSRIEPGVTPAAFSYVDIPTFTAYLETCGQSRVWAGVHFQQAVDESNRLCSQFGDLAYDFLQGYINGTADMLPPAQRLPEPYFY